MQTSQQFIVLPDLDKKIDEAIHDAINFFEKRCPYCKESLYSGHIRDKIHLDHFIPIAKGGQHVPWNLLPVCQKCNSKKNSKNPKLFLSPEVCIQCENYLNSIREKYVGEIQINLEKFSQVKTILKELNESINPISKYADTISLLSQIVLDLRQTNDHLTIEKLKYSICDLGTEINKYFKIPEQNDKVVKLSSTEIQEILSKKLNKQVSRNRVSKKLKELGFIQHVERTPEKVKRCYTLALT